LINPITKKFRTMRGKRVLRLVSDDANDIVVKERPVIQAIFLSIIGPGTGSHPSIRNLSSDLMVRQDS